MIYIVDIDGTICTINDDYNKVAPIRENIEKINKLHDEGHQVILWTARGDTTGIDWVDITLAQLEGWGVKYDTVEFGKPYYDVWIDDRAVRIEDV